MSEDKKDENINSSNENEENSEKVENQPSVDQNLDNSPDENSGENQNVSENQVKNDETANEVQKEATEHQVIHKKDGRLHIYIRQDKYKGELKSKNWVGRLYIDGKQKISSSGTQNLDEAIPILEKWFDDIHSESEKLKKLANSTNNRRTTTKSANNSRTT
jgi:type IV pilus assembly protein PilN